MTIANKIQKTMDEAIIVATKEMPVKCRSNRKWVKIIYNIFDGVDDFRQKLKITYELNDVLCMCLLIAMRGKFTSFSYASKYMQIRVDYFSRLGLVKNKRVPSHDTLRRIFMNIEPNDLRDTLLNRIKIMVEKIANHTTDNGKTRGIRLLSGDGKTFRGSGRKGNYPKRNVNVFNMFDVSADICLDSIPLDDKESEIPTMQRVLQKYNLQNSIVTADALHCQTKTVDVITKRGGLYCIAIKDNQSQYRENVMHIIKNKKGDYSEYIYNDCVYQISFINYETTDIDFPHAKAYVSMTSHKRKDQQNYNPEPMYFVTSADNPDLIMQAIDSRWSVEQMHWYKDVYLHEDSCTTTDKTAIKAIAVMNNIVYSIYRLTAALFYEKDMAKTRIIFEDCPETVFKKLMPLMEKQNLTNLLKANLKGRKKNED